MQTMRQTALLTLAIALALTGIGSAGGQTSGQPSQPTGTSQGTGRGPIQTKTPAEYQAYQAAIANAQNAQAMEKAADDFAPAASDEDDEGLRASLGDADPWPSLPPGAH